MNVGDRIEYDDPLLGRRVQGTVYYRERSHTNNAWKTFVRGDVKGGVTAVWDGMNIVVVETKMQSNYREMVAAALKRLKDSFGAKEI